MSIKVNVEPKLLRWARERADLDPRELARKVGLVPARITEWEETGQLTLDQLERVAQRTHTPIGFLFLREPPTLTLPVADFRTHTADQPRDPSPELLETLYVTEQRQSWYREEVAGDPDALLPFVGSARGGESPETVAGEIREAIRLSVRERSRFPTWEEALRDLLDKVEEAGILVMRNGIVGNNTHRPLNVSEFRGFAISDPYAPLIFVNAADSRSGQMFTVAHELVHIWRGETGVSDAAPNSAIPTERFCNQVAAELLVPREEFDRAWNRNNDSLTEARRLARVFKVSTLVVLIRATQAGVLDEDEFEALYAIELEAARRNAGGGGDFYRTQRSRLGRRFASAVVASALEGRTSYVDAYRLLGIRKGGTFNALARDLGVMP